MAEKKHFNSPSLQSVIPKGYPDYKLIAAFSRLIDAIGLNSKEYIENSTGILNELFSHRSSWLSIQKLSNSLLTSAELKLEMAAIEQILKDIPTIN
ncbi:MAG TPA: hypothetical protein VKB19_18400 [Pedobacter sp.]|nr:hypothetical protein [Pedobacter sp.]